MGKIEEKKTAQHVQSGIKHTTQQKHLRVHRGRLNYFRHYLEVGELSQRTRVRLS